MKKTKTARVIKLFLCFSLAFIFILLLFDTAAAAAAAAEALGMCFTVVIPSLFPFFVFSSLFVSLGGAKAIQRPLRSFMRPLFGVGGSCASALILGLTGGYPVGVRTTAELYKNGLCTKAEGEKLLTFCNNSGPGFILGIAGAGIFSSAVDGMLLYLIHILSALLVGIFFSRRRTESISRSELLQKRPPFAKAFTDAVSSSFSSCLTICAFVVFFSVVLKLITAAPPFCLLDGTIGLPIFSGFLELTNGILLLSDLSSKHAAFVCAAALLGFGGMSVHCQALSFLIGSGLNIRGYFLGKAAQCALSAALALLLCPII